jgi:uncharacterized membrane protein YfcA
VSPDVELIGPVGLLLVAVAFFNGAWNTAVGPTGGTMYATLAATLSPAVAIPVQSMVEGVSVAYRTWTLRHRVRFVFLGLFALGGLVGAGAGYLTIRFALTAPSGPTFQLLVAGLILVMTWVPLAAAVAKSQPGPALAGGVTTFLALFVGGMGAPIAAAVESRGEPHDAVIATYSAAIYLQYVARIAIFGIVGAALADLLPLVVALITASLAGTMLGARLLPSLDPDRSRRVFRAVVTLIALSIIVRVAVR